MRQRTIIEAMQVVYLPSTANRELPF